MNGKYIDPFEEIIFEVTFCRYPMRHGAAAVDGVGKGAAEGAVKVVTGVVAVLSAAIAAEQVVELGAEGAVEGTFGLPSLSGGRFRGIWIMLSSTRQKIPVY